MPIMNGLEATKAIRDIGDQKLSKIPIVAMTANAFDEDRKVASEAGMDGFITKPIILDEVISVISNILNKE